MTDLDTLADSATGSDPDGELRHLRSTIAALRLSLEDSEAERDALRQKVRATYEGDIAGLKITITALREALEELRHNGGVAVEGAVANSANEIAQLRQITQALREGIREPASRAPAGDSTSQRRRPGGSGSAPGRGSRVARAA